VAADAIQAVETGRNLIQAAPTGYSTVVTNRGRVVERSVLARQADLYATVPLRRGFTLYDHLGDMPFLILFGLALLAGWRRQRTTRTTTNYS
jgi:apolipoprotein N-acyltransferase